MNSHWDDQEQLSEMPCNLDLKVGFQINSAANEILSTGKKLCKIKLIETVYRMQGMTVTFDSSKDFQPGA